MTYKLTNQRYGNESVEVTIEELQALLRDVFGDDETKLEERSDGIYEVDGELVAKLQEDKMQIRCVTSTPEGKVKEEIIMSQKEFLKYAAARYPDEMWYEMEIDEATGLMGEKESTPASAWVTYHVEYDQN